MKKIPRWGKIVLSTILVVILLVVTLFGRTLYDFTQLNPLASGSITENVYAVQTGTANFFLIRGNSGYIAIDAGEDKERAAAELYALDISPEDVFAIFLTHSDSDHTAAISLFPNAKLHLSEYEVQLIDGTINRRSGLFLVLSMLLGRNSGNTNFFPYEFLTLTHNEKIEIDGVLIQGFLTPGHTPGSMSFLVNERYLFTGDAMSLRSGRAARMVHLFDMDNNQARESISKIATIPAQYIFTSHHGYSDNLAFVFENWD